MSDLEEKQLDTLDTLMARHLSAELDGQLGRAESAFLLHLAAGSNVTGSLSRRPAMRPRGWMFTTIGTALAACIAGLWAGPMLFPHSPPGNPVTVTPPPTPDRPPMVHYVHSRAWDGGMVILDNRVPARRVFREQVEHTEWYDHDQKARIHLTVPRHGFELLEVDTY